MSNRGELNTCWEKLFQTYDIVDKVNRNGYFKISANQIKRVKEPRLMTKFDFSELLPEVFVANKLAILPITRGDYIIGHFQCYQPLPTNPNLPAKYMPLPYAFQSLQPNQISSEQMALLAASISGIIADFVGVSSGEHLVQTIEGRQGSGNFAFSIQDNTKPITVNSRNNSIYIASSWGF